MVIKQRRVISISKLVICNAFFRPSLFEFWLESRDTSPASWIQTLRWADTGWLHRTRSTRSMNRAAQGRKKFAVPQSSFLVLMSSKLFHFCSGIARVSLLREKMPAKFRFFCPRFFFFCSYKDKYESVLRVSRRRSSLSISLPIRYQAKVNCATNVWISLAVIMNVLQFDLIPHRATTLQPSAKMGNICLSAVISPSIRMPSRIFSSFKLIFVFSLPDKDPLGPRQISSFLAQSRFWHQRSGANMQRDPRRHLWALSPIALVQQGRLHAVTATG